MPVRVRIHARGFERVEGVLQDQQRRAASFVRGISPLVVQNLQSTVRNHFLSQSGPGGWPPLAQSTIAKKGHSTILIETGRLLASLTGRSRDTILDVSRLRMRWGTRVPYAAFHEEGEGVPRRAFMPLGQDAADFASRRAVEHVLRLTPGSLGRGQR